MRPILLTMEAFGSYAAKTVIDFREPQQDLFLITGETGSGKTTIFDAIVYALYGEASSQNSVKRKGAASELHSQLVDDSKRAVVTLRFEEKGEIYQVTCESVYTEADAKGKVISRNSRVKLIMPDGEEHDAKNYGPVDDKLKELIGLEKKQFMQVAMIAQGEFMELLDNTFSSRKTTFRKFFDTGIYDDIQKKLAERIKDKKEQLHSFRSQYMAHASAVRLPDDSEYAEELQKLISGFASEENLKVSAIESFSSLLGSLCEELEARLSAAEKERTEASADYNEKRDALKSADQLLKNYQTLEEARRQLEKCEADAEEIKQAKELVSRINAAYTVEAAYRLFEQADKACTDTAAHLEAQKQLLPGLEKDCAAAAEGEKSAKEKADTASAEAAGIKARTDAALSRFRKIDEISREIGVKQGTLRKAEAASAAAAKSAAEHEANTDKLRKRQQELDGTQEQLVKYTGMNNAQTEIESFLSQAKGAEKDMAARKKAAEAAAEEYVRVQKEYLAARCEYDSRNTVFLNNQAGYIAREMLREGEKCPVCGSLHHPEPAEIPDVYSGITRETVDLLKAKADELGKKYTACAERSKNASENLEACRTQLASLVTELNERIRRYYKSVDHDLTLPEAEERIRAKRTALDAKLEELRRDEQELAGIKKDLGNADEESRRRAELCRQREAAAAEARSALENIRGQRDALERELTYASAEEAMAERDKAEAAHRTAEAAHAAALSKLTRARTAAENCRALIARDNEELPAKNAVREEKLSEYRETMETSRLSEDEWKQTVSGHERSEAGQLTKKINAHNETLSRAQTASDIAEKNIAGRPKPDIGKLSAAHDEADEKLKALTALCGELKGMYDTDNHLLEIVQPGLEERRRVCGEYDLLSSLNGKLSGRKIDIESYVQRWHLSQVLAAANVRFLEMTANQLELRLMEDDAEAAPGIKGEHGLSLMVRSVGTGKLRRVGRISGGEKFMAALSLALGMADRICESSSTVDLGILFIDEGFGSLSENKLRTSVRILKQLAGGTIPAGGSGRGSKLVGIISHVSALKQEIDDKLIVTKSERGSSVRWTQQ